MTSQGYGFYEATVDRRRASLLPWHPAECCTALASVGFWELKLARKVLWRERVMSCHF